MRKDTLSEESTFHDEVGKIVKPIFEKSAKSPQETNLNHTMVGITKPRQQKPSLYNPHNYRLYFAFNKQGYKPIKGMVGVWLGKLINYDKEFTACGEGIRVTVRKTQVEVINKLSEEQWYSIKRSKAKEEIQGVINKIEDKCISSLKRFIEVYGGSTDFKIINRECRGLYNNLNTKSDNKVMQESFIDSLPLDMTFETEVVKKVYKKPNVEFSNPLYAATYLENSALHENEPEISQHLKNIYTLLDETRKASTTSNLQPSKPISPDASLSLNLSELKSKITKIEDCKAYRSDIEKLSFQDNWDLANYILSNIYNKY